MRQRLSTIIALGFFFGTLAFVLWLGFPNADTGYSGDRIFAVTTIYPLQNFVERVGGDFVYVSNVIPAGTEPHDYEPSPRDVSDVRQADLLVYVGQGIDAWAADAGPDITQNGGLTLSAERIAGVDADAENADPHVWLDPVIAQDIVRAIEQALIALDPDHATDYSTQADAYLAELVALDADYAHGLEKCELNDIIVAHDAFGYLARRYNFVIHPISGLSPESEPSVRDLTNLARDAKKLDIQTIFFETLVSPELAETLARELHAETAVLNPLEGLSAEELASGKDYVSVMRDNLSALRAAMLCQ
ncbi:MAG TPA: zinc ABC transporter substrate-binding protein [bacterium]|nr:zinc ABC transporter substrate-binding protein [bacterium]